jgi:DNA-directed RNA polymerase subunit RPC12/RpoP
MAVAYNTKYNCPTCGKEVWCHRETYGKKCSTCQHIEDEEKLLESARDLIKSCDGNLGKIVIELLRRIEQTGNTYVSPPIYGG